MIEQWIGVDMIQNMQINRKVVLKNYLTVTIKISMTQRRLWTPEEDHIIQKLVEFHGAKKWTQIAQDMKVNYPSLSRSSKQIRQRWYNHLDPQINRNPWSEQEQTIIFHAHKKIGSKWKEIAKLLVSRTDNSVKNHFYSTLRRSLRRINKYLGFKNSTNQMRVLKPSILCKLVEEGQHNQQYRVLIDGIFQFSKIKPNKTTKTQQIHATVENHKKLYKLAIQKLTQINLKYSKNICPHKLIKPTQKRKSSKNSITSQTHIQIVQQIKQQKFSNFGELDTSKAIDSNNQYQLSISMRQFEQGNKHNELDQDLQSNRDHRWQESNNNQFLTYLPQFEKPDHDQDFIPAMEFKDQQLFFS